MVAYLFEGSHSGTCSERHLDRYRGILQVDGNADYNRLARPTGPMTACWSHMRRKFSELHATDSSQFTSRTVEIISWL